MDRIEKLRRQWISEMNGKSVDHPQYKDWVLWAANHSLYIDPTDEYWELSGEDRRNLVSVKGS